MNKKNYNNSDSASTGTLSINQVKVLNLEDFNSRIEEMSIDKNEFPTEQYYEKGFYYAVEKKNKITICTKGQWDSYCRQVVRAYTRGKNQPVFTKVNFIKLAVCSIIATILVVTVVRNNSEKLGSPTANNNNAENYTQSAYSTTKVQSCI